MKIRFDMLVSRGVALWLSHQLVLAGMKTSLNDFIKKLFISSILLMFASGFIAMLLLHLDFLVASMVAIGAGVGVLIFAYMIMQYRIDARKSKVEAILADFFQITAANLRSGVSLDKSMLLSARPEFGFFSDDIKKMIDEVFGGKRLEDALTDFSKRYTSLELQHAIRMINESLRYGGAMADLIEQLARDIRDQQLTQKEISGQLFLYSIFIAFAGVAAAPVLYGLTSQMIVITDGVWKGILASNPNGLPSEGVGFLKPSPPVITPQEYENFSIIAIIIITAFASLIMSAISSGSAAKGLKLMPVFVIAGVIAFYLVRYVIGMMFATLSMGAG
ncbi:MAG: type II secretion system F family protein [Candidatus Micrarchaeia archaeon]